MVGEATSMVAWLWDHTGFLAGKWKFVSIPLVGRYACGRKTHLQPPTAMSSGRMTSGGACVILNHFLV